MTHQMIETNGATLAVTDSGTGPDTFLFLHYWGGSSRTWTPVVEFMAPHARCITIDQRGWGDSVAVDGRYDLQAMADDVLAVAAYLKLDRYVLVGHSMGGKVAQIVAGRRPEGLAGLVLVAPAPAEPMPVPAEQRAGMLAAYQSRGGVLQVLPILTAAPLPEPLAEQVIEDTLRGAPGAKQAWTETEMLADARAGLAGVSLPVQVLVGDKDLVEREAMLREILPGLLPQARFTRLAGIGHLAPLEAPKAVADACLAAI